MNYLSHPTYVLFAGGFLVGLSLAIALVAQYGFHIWPCDLCVVQRWPALFAVIVALLVGAVGKPRFMLALFMMLCLITASIAFYHTGIEESWWQGPTSCSGDDIDSSNMTLEELTEKLNAAPIIRCDKPAIEVMGLTMASANFLFSLGLAVLAFISLVKSRKGKDHVEIS